MMGTLHSLIPVSSFAVLEEAGEHGVYSRYFGGKCQWDVDLTSSTYQLEDPALHLLASVSIPIKLDRMMFYCMRTRHKNIHKYVYVLITESKTSFRKILLLPLLQECGGGTRKRPPPLPPWFTKPVKALHTATSIWLLGWIYPTHL